MDIAISILVAGNGTAYKNGKKLINVTDFVKVLYSSATETKLITNNALDEVTITHASVGCLLYTSPSPRDRQKSRMPSSA